MPDASSNSQDIAHLRAQLGSENPKPAIQTALSISRNIEARLRTSPLETLAGLSIHLQRTSSSNQTSQLGTTLTLFFHLAKMNHFNMSSATSIAAGLILSLETEALDTHHRAEVRRVLYRALNKINFTAASDILRIAKLLNVPGSSNYYAKFRLSLWQWFALTSSLLTNESQKTTWQDRLANTFTITPHWYHECLAKLIEFPSFIPPGSLVQYNEKTLMTLFCKEDKLLVFDGKKTNYLDKESSLTVRSVAKPKDLCVYMEQSEFSPPYPEYYRINQPPRSLTKILEQVQAIDCDIDKLASDIEHEASLANFMRESASSANRLNLAVSSVKQAIMTYGIERIGDMLVTYALFQRLTQNNFPIRDSLVDHLQLSMAMGAELAERSKVMLPQTCALMVLVCQTALFTNANLKSLSNWSLDNASSTTDYSTIHSSLSATEFKVAAVNIGKAWRLSKSMLAKIGRVFDSSNANGDKTTALMQLILHWSLLSKMGLLQFDKTQNALEKRLLSSLSLSLDSKIQCLQAVTEHLKCSLSNH